jgi:Uri superfamily endonuclease
MTRGICGLAISVSKGIQLNIGALSRISFEKGTYVYVGSAQNNLEKRVDRHLGEVK